MDWSVLMAASTIESAADLIPQVDLFGLKGFVEKLTDAFVAAIVWVLRLVAQGLLLLLLLALEPLTFQTPAVATPIGDVDNVVAIDQLIDPNSGIIPRFQQMTLRIATAFLSAGVLVSFIMLGLGIFPRVGDMAKSNLARIVPAGVFAYFTPTFAQLLIEVAQAATNMVYSMGDYDALVEELFLGVTLPTNADNELGLLIGMLVASIALLIVVLELAARFGIIVFLSSIAPLVTFAYAFNFSRGFASKATQFFVSTVFFQFFVAIGVTIMLHAMVAFQGSPDTSSIPAWALLAGLSATIAYFPKILSGASEAIGAAMAPAKTAVMAAAAIGTIGAAGAVMGASKVAGGATSVAAGMARDSTSRAGQFFHHKLSQASTRLQGMDQGRIRTFGKRGWGQLKHMGKDAVGLGGMTRHAYDDIQLGPRPPRPSKGQTAAPSGAVPASSRAPKPPAGATGEMQEVRPKQPVTSGLSLEPSRARKEAVRPPASEGVQQSRTYRFGAAVGNLARRKGTTGRRQDQDQTGGTAAGLARQNAAMNVLATQTSVDALQTTAKNLKKSRGRFDKQLGKDLGQYAKQWGNNGTIVQHGADSIRNRYGPRDMAHQHDIHRAQLYEESVQRVQEQPSYEEAIQAAQEEQGGPLNSAALQRFHDGLVEQDPLFQQRAAALDSAFERTASARGVHYETRGNGVARTYHVNRKQRAVIPAPHAVQRRQDALRAASRVAQPRLADSSGDVGVHRQHALEVAEASFRGEVQQIYGRSGMDVSGFAAFAAKQVESEDRAIQGAVRGSLGQLRKANKALQSASSLADDVQDQDLASYAGAGPAQRQLLRLALYDAAVEGRVQKALESQPHLGLHEVRHKIENEQSEGIQKQLAPVTSVLDRLDEAAGLTKVQGRLTKTHASQPMLDADGLHATLRESIVTGAETGNLSQRHSANETLMRKADLVALRADVTAGGWEDKRSNSTVRGQVVSSQAEPALNRKRPDSPSRSSRNSQ